MGSVQRIINTSIQRDLIFHLNLWMKETQTSGEVWREEESSGRLFLFLLCWVERERGMSFDRAQHYADSF